MIFLCSLMLECMYMYVSLQWCHSCILYCNLDILIHEGMPHTWRNEERKADRNNYVSPTRMHYINIFISH